MNDMKRITPFGQKKKKKKELLHLDWEMGT